MHTRHKRDGPQPKKKRVVGVVVAAAYSTKLAYLY